VPTLPEAICERFIARTDTKAQQLPQSKYNRLDEPWTLEDIEAHLTGEISLGHYLLDQESRCKLFAYDIDLDKTATWDNGQPYEPRAVWKEPSVARTRLQRELRALAEALAWRVKRLYGITTAVSYSGSKGLHVYGFTGLRPADEVRDLAVSALDCGAFELVRGNAFWKHRAAYQALTIEVFPKQDSIKRDAYGNLMRLPLGRHAVSGKPGFFLKLSAEQPKFVPDDPEKVLAFGSFR
jgi:hypothetical protein